MHDDQHIARLYLLDQGIRQGDLFPRWVGILGFGYGYPLFNFYPPLIYYLGELFHLSGFSFIWSIKLMIISGFILAAWGIYYLIKDLLGRWPAILGAAVYTYFFYHAVNVYVRGALAEFFAMAVLPFVFLFLHKLYRKSNLKNSFYFGLSLAMLILTHPLIALPAVIFIGFSFLFHLFLLKEGKGNFVKYFMAGTVIGLTLSAFFWLPSLAEKKYTLTDKVLTTELADYKKHFVCPYQFWYSPWGYGGSGEDCQSGLTFQLGKIPILLAAVSLALSLLVRKKRRHYYFFVFLSLFSLFMATGYSSFIWDNVSYLAYLQWPWRFLTFTALFVSIVSSYAVYYLERSFDSLRSLRTTVPVVPVITIIIVIVTIVKYQQYFRPQKLIAATDKERTAFAEIAWRVSGTSYEFVPKGVKTKKTVFKTTTLAIEEKDLPQSPYQLVSGQAAVRVKKDNFTKKIFNVNAATPLVFRLNTYYFPGWEAVIDGEKTAINDGNDLKLITVNVPPGTHTVEFRFVNTPVRTASEIISVSTVIFLIGCFFLRRRLPDKISG